MNESIKILGSGSSLGIPIIGCKCKVCNSNNPLDKRLRSSVLITIDNKKILIDSGPDFRQQMLKEKINHLDFILLTHGHVDHIGGLNEITTFNYLQKQAIDVYGCQHAVDAVKANFPYFFYEDKYPSAPDVSLHLLQNKTYNIQGIDIIPIEVKHGDATIFGYRINDFVYISDASFISEKEKMKIMNAKVLIIGAIKKETHYSHFSLGQALELIEEVKPEKAYITHISHMMGLHEITDKELPKNVSLAYDGLQISY